MPKQAYLTATDLGAARMHMPYLAVNLNTGCGCCSAFNDPEVQSVMVQQDRDGLTQTGFMSKWAFLTATNPRAALVHMLYLGVKLNTEVMQCHFHTSRPRQLERKKARDSQCRTLFQVCLANMSHESLIAAPGISRQDC